MGGRSSGRVTGVLAGAIERRRLAGAEFLDQADVLTRACHAMATRFERGGRLLVAGTGLSEADARHVAVEFVHPVIVGKRGLPAIAIARPEQVGVLARPGDIVMAIASNPQDAALTGALAAATNAGALTVALVAGSEENTDGLHAEHVVRAAGGDPRVVRELHVTAYHVLWELVHVFLEGSAHAERAPEGTSCPACADAAVTASVIDLLPGEMARVVTPAGIEEISVALVDATVGSRVLVHAGEAIGTAPDEPTTPEHAGAPAGLASLYPFLYGNGTNGPVHAQVRSSTEEKIREIADLRGRVLDDEAEALAACAGALARAFETGATLFTFGNGGSSTDALALARLFVTPGGDDEAGAFPAVSLPEDAATVTALANDVSFDVVYARQLAALASSRDVALGISTSGSSENVVRALRDARSRGLQTIGLAGSGGGNMKDVGSDHFFVVGSSSVHRVQEAQTTLYHVLWELTRAAPR